MLPSAVQWTRPSLYHRDPASDHYNHLLLLQITTRANTTVSLHDPAINHSINQLNSLQRTTDQYSSARKRIFGNIVGDLDLWTYDLQNVISVMSNCDKFHHNSPCILETGERMPPKVLIWPHVVSLWLGPLALWPQNLISSSLSPIAQLVVNLAKLPQAIYMRYHVNKFLVYNRGRTHALSLTVMNSPKTACLWWQQQIAGRGIITSPHLQTHITTEN